MASSREPSVPGHGQAPFKRELLTHVQQLQGVVHEWFMQHENLITGDVKGDLVSSQVSNITTPMLAEPSETRISHGTSTTSGMMLAETAPDNLKEVAELALYSKSTNMVNGCRLTESAATSPRQVSSPWEEIAEQVKKVPTRATDPSGRSHAASDSATVSCETGASEIVAVREFPRESRSCLYLFVRSPRFTYICAIVIFANAIVIGLSADYAIQHPDNPEHATLDNLEIAFTMFYILELALMVFVHRWKFFCGLDWRWNLFDVLLILQSVYDHADKISLNLTSGNVSNYSFLRMLRLAKMLKLVRVIRLLRSFRELRLLLSCLLGCVKSSTWAIILVAVMSYMFGIGLLQSCATYMGSGSELSDRDREDIDRYWGSVAKSMLTLYQATMGGEDWIRFARPFEQMGGLVYGLFLCYIGLFDFVVVNTISSIFVEAMMNNSAHDQQLVIEEMMERKEEYITKLAKLYAEMDDDNDGKITYKEFCHHVERPEMKAFVASLDIDAYDARQFFRILSGDKDKPVDLDTFVEGCIRLKGVARSMDLMDLHYICKNSFAELHDIHKETKHYFHVLEQMHSMLRRSLANDLHPKAKEESQGDESCNGVLNHDQLDMRRYSEHSSIQGLQVSHERSHVSVGKDLVPL